MADNKRPGYAGSIQNTGAQKVNAPFWQNSGFWLRWNFSEKSRHKG